MCFKLHSVIVVTRAGSPEFDSRQDLFFFLSSLLFFLFLDVTSSFQLLQFCFVSLYSLSFLQFINFLSYCLVSLLTSCRSPVVLREVLRFTAKLADISANCAEHFIKYECLDYSLSVVQAAQVICMVGGYHATGTALTYWGGGNYTPQMCLCGLSQSCAYISSL